LRIEVWIWFGAVTLRMGRRASKVMFGRGEREGFRPQQRGTFPLAVVRALLPCTQEVEPLLTHAASAGVLRVHVDAVRAAVELGDAGLHQFNERTLQARLGQVEFEPAHRTHGPL
jgi:hypothetical protein